jgi:hypothetical protein
MEIYDRKNKIVIEEQEYQKKTLDFLYTTKKLCNLHLAQML